jgi:hypothetical protein
LRVQGLGFGVRSSEFLRFLPPGFGIKGLRFEVKGLLKLTVYASRVQGEGFGN